LSAQLAPTEADAYIVAVPTPFKDDYQPDLKYIESAAKALAPFLKPGNLVILESTSPVEATEQMSAWLSEARPDLSFPQQKVKMLIF
jgi:UDP-N-acetyl-D-mannosaminuronic acid dehydrogenase